MKSQSSSMPLLNMMTEMEPAKKNCKCYFFFNPLLSSFFSPFPFLLSPLSKREQRTKNFLLSEWFKVTSVLFFSLKHSLTTWGEKFTEKEWESMVSEAPMAGNGKIDIKKWAKIITGAGDDE